MIAGQPINFAEELALSNVILPSLQADAAAHVHPNYKIIQSNGKNRFIDFAIISEQSRIAIEIDGYTYHAEGAISRERFNDQLDRQNELVLDGWKVLRFSFDQIRDDAEFCRGKLRRMLISDDVLHPNFSKSRTLPTAIQIEALKALQETRERGYTRGLIAIPTGTGKTILSAMDAKTVGGRVLFVAHNNEILRQAASAYKKIIPDASIGFINSTEEPRNDSDIIFANIASLRRLGRLKNFQANDFSYVVVDEFHHGAAPSYKELLGHFTPTFLLGLTATPNRTDSKDILAFLERNLVYSLTSSEAIERGYLVPFTYFGLKDDVDYSNIKHNGYRYDIGDLERLLFIPKRDAAIVDKYKELTPGMKSIGFCVSIEHTERMADVFRQAGIPSSAIHSNLNMDDRAQRIKEYEHGDTLCVFTRDIFNEGVDLPATEALLFLRPTESKIIFTQQLGRGLRLSPRKNSVRILDFIGNYKGSDAAINTIREIAGDKEKGMEGTSKPELVYDNGCSISFEEELIDDMVAPEHRLPGPSFYFQKIASQSDKLDRALTPIDLYLLLGDQTASAILACSGYKGFVDRINSLDDENEILDSEFSGTGLNSDKLLDIEYGDPAAIAQQCLGLLTSMFTTMKELTRKKSWRSCVDTIWDVHDNCTELVNNLSLICLAREHISQVSGLTEAAQKGNLSGVFFDSSIEYFLKYIAENSALRDAHAKINFIRRETGGILATIATYESSEATDSASINFLLSLTDKRQLNWLIDLLDLTSYRSIDI